MDYQHIMSRVFKHCTYREITSWVGCSRRDVAAAKKAIKTHGITPERLAMITSADFEQLFPDGRKAGSAHYADQHFGQIMEQMKHSLFFRLQQGWVQYMAGPSEKKKYSYSQYCALFNQYVLTHYVVAVLQHEPDKSLYVDWAGPSCQG